MQLKDILVPIDFSDGSLRALQFADSVVDVAGEIYLLHVVDADFVGRIADAGFAGLEDAVERMRRRAEERLQEIIRGRPAGGARADTMVVVGMPFAEILRIAADLDFQAIVMSIRGQHEGSLEELLFGSTAEKVLRGAGIPVICVPSGPRA